MNKASMIQDMCSRLEIKYTSSMHCMTLKELQEFYNAFIHQGND